MSIADKLPAEPLTVTRADFEAVAAKLYEAGMKQGAMDAAKRCVELLMTMHACCADHNYYHVAANTIASEFGLGEKKA